MRCRSDNRHWMAHKYLYWTLKRCSFMTQISNIDCTCMLNVACKGEVIRISSQISQGEAWGNSQHPVSDRHWDQWSLRPGSPHALPYIELINMYNKSISACVYSWSRDTSEESCCRGSTQRMGVSCPSKGSPETICFFSTSVQSAQFTVCKRQREYTSRMESTGRSWFSSVLFFSNRQTVFHLDGST